jgi:hypothetical protein
MCKVLKSGGILTERQNMVNALVLLTHFLVDQRCCDQEIIITCLTNAVVIKKSS